MDLEKIAGLAGLDAGAAERLKGQFEAILAYIERLKTLDTEGVRPFVSPGGARTVARECASSSSTPRQRRIPFWR